MELAFNHEQFVITHSNMASSMLQLAYGYHPKNSHDSFFKSALEATTNTAIAGMPTSKCYHSAPTTLDIWRWIKSKDFLVNVFPALTNVPDWFPGTNWKRVARVWREVKEQAVKRPYEWTKAQVVCVKYLSKIILLTFVSLGCWSVWALNSQRLASRTQLNLGLDHWRKRLTLKGTRNNALRRWVCSYKRVS